MENETPDVASDAGSDTPELMMSEGYGIAPYKILFDNQLPDSSKLLYIYITGLCAATGVCWSKNKHLAEKFGVQPRQISRWLAALEEAGYVLLAYEFPEEKTGKREIHLLGFVNKWTKKTSGVDKNVYSNRQSATEITEANNKLNNKPNKYTETELSESHKAYNLYLIKHKINPHQWNSSDEETRKALLTTAQNRYKLTPERRHKIILRLRDAGYNMVGRAIVNVSKSSWHMGDNPDGKKYNDLTEFILKSYEQVENWANKEVNDER